MAVSFGEFELSGGGLNNMSEGCSNSMDKIENALPCGSRRRPVNQCQSSLDFNCPLSRTYSKSSSTPWGTTTDLVKVSKRLERGLVSQRDIDDAVMCECAHCCDSGALLTSSLSFRRDE